MFQLKEGKWGDLEGGRLNSRICSVNVYCATPEDVGSLFFKLYN